MKKTGELSCKFYYNGCPEIAKGQSALDTVDHHACNVDCPSYEFNGNRKDIRSNSKYHSRRKHR